MNQKVYKSFSTKETPQSQPIPGTDQVANNAGGFAWAVDDWTRLDRFLILGSDAPTYYVGAVELTKRNAEAVMRCIKNDGLRTVERIAEISESGRAFRNDPALFALAMASGVGNDDTRKAALDALPRVARIPTHLYHFNEYSKQFRGWGRGMRNANRKWFESKTPDTLAYHAIKYQSRDGWSMRDVLRKAHPKADMPVRQDIYEWVVQGWGDKELSDEAPKGAMAKIWAFEKAKQAQSDKEIVRLIADYNLPRECIPTEYLNSKAVWDALLQHMPFTAMIRNLPKMTKIGLLEPMSDAAISVNNRLLDQEQLKKARVHPMSVLMALTTYSEGRGVRGSLTWQPVTSIVNALDKAFYLSFGNVVPTGKRIMLALDVSGSMVSSISGTHLSCRQASVAMALITANVEPNYMTTIFSSAGTNFTKTDKSAGWWADSGMSEWTLSSRQRLDDVVAKMYRMDFGGTDCALPMLYAMERKYKIDAFIVYTDSETWAGDIHPTQALNQYRDKFGIPARLVVVGMTSGGFTIADPNDSGMLDCVGFDTATPNLISDFIKGDV